MIQKKQAFLRYGKSSKASARIATPQIYFSKQSKWGKTSKTQEPKTKFQTATHKLTN